MTLFQPLVAFFVLQRTLNQIFVKISILTKIKNSSKKCVYVAKSLMRLVDSSRHVAEVQNIH